MTATYTFDVFTSLDGFGAHSGNWGGYWGKQGPELLMRGQEPGHRCKILGILWNKSSGLDRFSAHCTSPASIERSEIVFGTFE